MRISHSSSRMPGTSLKRSTPVREKIRVSHQADTKTSSPKTCLRNNLEEANNCIHEQLKEIALLVNSLDSIPTVTVQKLSTIRSNTNAQYNPSTTGFAQRLEAMLKTLRREQVVTQESQLDYPLSSTLNTCAHCNEVIKDNAVTALDKTWHLEHFLCSHCSKSLCSENFYENNGQAYCFSCHQDLFCPKCVYCQDPILDKCLVAMDKNWHPEHFFCQDCQHPFDEKLGFHEHNQRPYCSDCFHNQFGPKCVACSLTITDTFISALDGEWHNDCFVCQECHQPFKGGNFFEIDGKPYCKEHYYSKNASICYKCKEPIIGRCVNALGRKYHPEHFTCCFCKNELNTGLFKQHSSNRYCYNCFEMLFR